MLLRIIFIYTPVFSYKFYIFHHSEVVFACNSYVAAFTICGVTSLNRGFLMDGATRTGKRILFVRELLGMTRDEFAKASGMSFNRLNNIENLLAKVNEEEFYYLGRTMPDVLPFIACEGEINLQHCRDSKYNLCRLLAARVDNNQIPENNDLVKLINRGS